MLRSPLGCSPNWGPALGFPYSSKINGSRHSGMRELRIRSGGIPLRTAILLIGANRVGDDRWYERSVPLADRIYNRYLAELEEERKRSKIR